MKETANYFLTLFEKYVIIKRRLKMGVIKI